MFERKHFHSSVFETVPHMSSHQILLELIILWLLPQGYSAVAKVIANSPQSFVPIISRQSFIFACSEHCRVIIIHFIYLLELVHPLNSRITFSSCVQIILEICAPSDVPAEEYLLSYTRTTG